MPIQTTVGRRSFLAGAGSFLALTLAGCASTSQLKTVAPDNSRARQNFSNKVLEMYRAMPEEQFAVPAAELHNLDPAYQRTKVTYATAEKPGTVIVDTVARYLYHVHDDGTSTRYGVGIGRAGFEWAGRAHVAYGREWPVWTPPADMIARQPELDQWRSGHPPGIDNPLGARALYIHQGNRDTLYRLHGTGEAHTIGKAVSSGCVRLLHQDIIHLYERVKWGSPIVVLA